MAFTPRLLLWYHQNSRDLPWRETREPYKIWISEIIFQQTRIIQGLDYYLRFTARYPDIASLAAAREEDILKMWQGLGYYSRARNLHKAARTIMQEFNGVFPSRYDDILKLSGIGDYTAAAIASVSFGLPYPVMDGNVLRFFSRYSGNRLAVDSPPGKAAVQRFALKHIDKKNPGDFNQAAMEFGALYCKPSKPDCPACIFKNECVAFKTGSVDEIPVKQKAKRPGVRYFSYLVFFTESGKGKTLFLNKREKDDIWRNMYDFPCIETDSPVGWDELFAMPAVKAMTRGSKPVMMNRSAPVRHVLTHRIIQAVFYEIRLNRSPQGIFQPVSTSEFFNYPIPKLIENFVTGSDIFK